MVKAQDIQGASDRVGNNTSYYLILVFSILAVAIGSTGYVFYHRQKANIIREKQGDLSAIADLKVGLIKEWREEQLADARSIFRNHLISHHFHEFFERPRTSGQEKEIITWLTSLHDNYKYSEVRLYDGHGKLQLSLFTKGREADPYDAGLIAEALRTREIRLADIHDSKSAGAMRLHLVVPIMDERDNVRTAAVLLLNIDPSQFLFPLIQTWPAPSSTAETLLVRREGDEVVFLNELRHWKNAPLSLRLPLTLTQLPAAMAVLGKEGIVEGLDYRNVPVIAAIRSIPDSPWFIVSKVDREEIYADLHSHVRFVASIVLVLIITAGLSVILWWRQQKVTYYRRQYATELRFNEERERSHTLLSENEARLKKAQEIARLGNWELDVARNVLSWSDEVYRIFGLQPQEFAATYEAFLQAVHPDDREAVDEAYSRSLREGRDTYEIDHRIVRKSAGEIRYVHEKCEHHRDETGRIVRSIGMVHDITDRKLAEREREKLIADLQKALSEIKTLHGILPICSHCKKIRDDEGSWTRMEDYIRTHTEVEFSHGLCQECANKLYPKYFQTGDKKEP